METFVPKETAQRLIRDVRQILKNPLTDQGIYYVHDETNIMKGYAMIVGPVETPYFGGFYFFEFTYPYNYPHSPPKVNYCTNDGIVCFNPNLYKNGKVCVSILNTWNGDQWTSCQTISSVLLALCSLLCPNPILNEPGFTEANEDKNKYNEIIEYSNINVAVCDIVDKKIGIYQPFFEHFYSHIIEQFNKNYEEFLKFSEKKFNTIFKKERVIKTRYCRMRVIINYDSLIQKLKKTKENIDKL